MLPTNAQAPFAELPSRSFLDPAINFEAKLQGLLPEPKRGAVPVPAGLPVVAKIQHQSSAVLWPDQQ
jgi:hypothetical protein